MTTIFSDPYGSPKFSTVIVPTLPRLGLSDAERAMIVKLQARRWRLRAALELPNAYYGGMQLLTNLGIAIPPELSELRTIVGWPRIAVDPYIERLATDGFRLRGATDANSDLADVWSANGMAAEESLAFLDALSMGRGYLTVDSPLELGDAPVVGAESPLNMSVAWDAVTGLPSAGLQSYWLDERPHATLRLPDQTIKIGEDDDGVWQLLDRDVHNFGRVSINRIANRPRSNARDGASEITSELMSITDAACRTLLNLDVASELYSVPQKLLLGVSESDFKAADGSVKTAWSTYISRILALERDEEGQLPQIAQFKAYDPSVYTKVVELYASQAAGIMAATPQDLGLYTVGNPVSAEAAQVSESRRDRRARRMHAIFGVSLVQTAQMVMRYLNAGKLPPEFRTMEVDWLPVEMPNVAGTADALSKYMAQGAVPPTSDVTLSRAGFTALERARLAQDRALDPDQALLDEIGAAQATRIIRSASNLANVAEAAAAPPVPPGMPGTPGPPAR